ncbi:MAG: DUF2804 domain-containing protein [Clostridia bacterium]|nr:DUF2804 domain-containing protein [Clostridia bacterium]
MDYTSIIKRKVEPTPKDVHIDGKAVFGTFDKEFENMNFLDINKPVPRLPDCFKKLKLTLWEAVEVNLKDGILLAAPCDMGVFGTILVLFYNKKEKKVYKWEANTSAKDVTISKTLLNGDESVGNSKNLNVKVINNFGEGKATVIGKGKGHGGEIEYNFELTRVSTPCVVSIPFGENRPLYSQKDFFKAVGSVSVNGVTYTSDEDTTAIIDDHRGYYPRKAHYDWVTTMGVNDNDGERKYIAFNLTRNQSIDQDKYNENLIWFEGSQSLLPPVKFVHETETRWRVTDEYGMVDVVFDIGDTYARILHAGIINIDYYVTFGDISGYVTDLDGKKYILDGMHGIGEDKSLLF